MEKLSDYIEWNKLDRKYLFYMLKRFQKTLASSMEREMMAFCVERLRGKTIDGQKSRFPDYYTRELEIKNAVHDSVRDYAERIGEMAAYLEWFAEVLPGDIQPEIDIQYEVRSAHDDVIYHLNREALNWGTVWHETLRKWGLDK